LCTFWAEDPNDRYLCFSRRTTFSELFSYLFRTIVMRFEIGALMLANSARVPRGRHSFVEPLRPSHHRHLGTKRNKASESEASFGYDVVVDALEICGRVAGSFADDSD
jgi:hypothetical protein